MFRATLRSALFSAAVLGACTSTSPAPTEGFLTGAGGVRLYFRVLGSAPDTIVVVHGGPGAGMGTILPHVQELGERNTVILYDQRGGGRSDLPTDTTLLEAQYFIEDLEAVRQYFGLRQMNLIAHSFGAILVARYAQQYPEKVARMVFLGATGPERAQAAAAAQAVYASADSATLKNVMEVMRDLLSGTAADPVQACHRYEELFSSLNPSGSPDVWKGTSCDMPKEAVAYYFRHTAQQTPASFGEWDFTSGLDDMAAPLLVVHGGADSLGHASQKAWAAALPEARILVVDGAGKGAIAERPEIVLDAIETFVRGSWPEGAEPYR